jgi:hypothetical protein
MPTAPACSGDCYTDSAATTAGEAGGPGGVTMEYVFANGSSGFKIWKEKGGSRILNSTGLIANGWQKELTRAGTAFSETNFTVASHIAGRVCPTHVFLSHSNMTSTGRCLYYDGGNDKVALNNASSGTLGEDYLVAWNDAGSGQGSSASYYEGNIKTCADKGMRLPTTYETTVNKHSSDLPTGDNLTNDPIWAGSENGVPYHSVYTWTATANPTNTTTYRSWNGTSDYGSGYPFYYHSITYSGTVRCVLPDDAPAQLPGAPTAVSGTAKNNTEITVSWTAPESNGGASITDYVVQYSSNSGSTWTTFADGTSALTRATVTGLTTGAAYIFKVATTNSVGTGSYSSNSASVTAAIPACSGDCYAEGSSPDYAQDLDIGTERQGPDSTTLTLQ